MLLRDEMHTVISGVTLWVCYVPFQDYKWMHFRKTHKELKCLNQQLKLLCSCWGGNCFASNVAPQTASEVSWFLYLNQYHTFMQKNPTDIKYASDFRWVELLCSRMAPSRISRISRIMQKNCQARELLEGCGMDRRRFHGPDPWKKSVFFTMALVDQSAELRKMATVSDGENNTGLGKEKKSASVPVC